MSARRIGFLVGLLGLIGVLILPAPATMSPEAWIVAGLVVLMAAWWMTEAIPLTATALMPFVVLPFAGVGTAAEVASDYYSPILFLILGGAFLALAIERTGLHRRLAASILDLIGNRGGPFHLMLAFMIAAAILSNIISNTSTTLIMMPMALAVIAGAGVAADEKLGLAGALPMAIAFAASIGGLGTIIGSPTNAIAVAVTRETMGFDITFAYWSLFGVPVVILGVPLAAVIIARVQRIADHPFDTAAAREAIDPHGPWTTPEKRVLPVIAVAFLLWMTRPLTAPLLPEGSLTDGTIAVMAGLVLFVLPDGTGRPMLRWEEADRAPWGVIMMFGGGLALASAMGRSGLADWLGQALLPLSGVPLPIVAIAIVAMVVLITEFASNVATASGIVPVVASLAAALGGSPELLILPAALASSWGFMLPAGTGPNAIAWATGRIELKRMVGSGLLIDLCGIFLIVAVVFAVSAAL